MVNLKVVNRYVHALILAAREKNLVDEVEKAVKETELFLAKNREVTSVLYHPSISRERKKRFMSVVLGNRYPEVFEQFISFVIDKKREKILQHLYAVYRKTADELNGIIRAKVKSPSEMSHENSINLSRQLEKLFSKKIILEQETDEALIGGFQVFLGSYIIDGSVKTRMQNIHRFLRMGVGQLKQASITEEL